MISPTWEAGLRTLGGVIAFSVIGAVLTWFASLTNVETILNPTVATIVAGLAATALAMFDKAYSPSGTIGFGSVG